MGNAYVMNSEASLLSMKYQGIKNTTTHFENSEGDAWWLTPV
jgi:hypothetical protein